MKNMKIGEDNNSNYVNRIKGMKYLSISRFTNSRRKFIVFGESSHADLWCLDKT